jgi:hypothetical protein
MKQHKADPGDLLRLVMKNWRRLLRTNQQKLAFGSV